MRPRKTSRSELANIRTLDELRTARNVLRMQAVRHEEHFAHTYQSIKQAMAWTSLLSLAFKRAEDYGRLFARGKEIFEYIRNAWKERREEKREEKEEKKERKPRSRKIECDKAD